jgi:hypothetical protein
MQRRFVWFTLQLLLWLGSVCALQPIRAQVIPSDSLSETVGDSLVEALEDSLAEPESDSLAVGPTNLKSGGRPGKLMPGGGGDTLTVSADSLVAHIKDSLKQNSDIKEPIKYSAKDSIEMIMDSSILILHNTAVLGYQEMSLEAYTIKVNWGENMMSATGHVDSVGKYADKPVLTEDGQKYLADSMKYNLKSQRGIVKQAVTQDGDSYITGETIKKSNDGAYYIKEGRFTTCDHPDPHFYIRSPKLKIIPKKQIISGPLNFVIEDLPIPIVIPFGVFPNQTGRRSGIVFPTYGESPERGFFLRDGGYYFAISDKVDLLLKGDIYTNGSFRLDGSTSYNVRYKLDGTFGLEYGRQRYLEDNGDIRVDNNFAVKWTHNQTIDPTSSFRSSVNAASSGFFQRNSYNERDYLQNTLKSSITYSKSFANSPFRLTASLDHAQNLQTKIVDLGLPNLQFAKARTFPFKPKKGVSRGRFYEKIGYSYTLDLTNKLSVPDSLFAGVLFNPTGQVTYHPSETDTLTNVTRNSSTYFKNGIRHSIPITTQFNALKYINFTPNFTFNEFWYLKRQEKTYFAAQDSVGISEVNGFSAARSFQTGISASTRIYGIFAFKKSERKTAIRHTMAPTFTYTYKPDFSTDFWGYYKDVQIDTTGKTERYNPYSIGAYGGPASGEQQSVTFSLQNLLELKTMPRKRRDSDTTDVTGAEEKTTRLGGAAAQDSVSGGKKKDEFMRVNLLDNFGLSATYNFAAKELNLSDINLDARTNLFKNKLQVQSRAALDPYKVDAEGKSINTFYWQGSHARMPRMSLFNFALSTTLASKKTAGGKRTDRVTEDEWRDIQYFRDMYVDFDLPWKSTVGVVLNYTNSGLVRDTTVSLNLTGDFNLTPHWKIGYTSGYDFMEQDFSYTSFSIYRDLHCWELSMTWIPFGDRKSYFLTLNVKSSTLKDLKLTKRNDWQDRF